MNRRLLAAVLGAMLCAAPLLAEARVIVGFHFGIPLYWPGPYYYPAPYYYPPPYYYNYAPPPVYYVPAPAPQPAPPPGPEATAPEGAFSWHFCAESNAYYPYVRECPGGWQRVPANPPPPPPPPR